MEIGFALSSIGASGPVRLEIFDLAGRRIAGLAEGTLTPGLHARVWDGRAEDGTMVGSGVYFARMAYRGKTLDRKLLLLR